MDIKLNARLSAYTRVDTVKHECDTERVTYDQIDTLFESEQNSSEADSTSLDGRVSKSAIDSLFN